MRKFDLSDRASRASVLACSLALAFAVFGPLAGACSCSSSGDDGPPTTEDGGTTPPEGGSPDATDGGSSPPGDLQIVSLTSTKFTITGGAPNASEAASVTFNAVVTDIHGLDAIAGGELLDDGDAAYAAFRAEGQGTYAATVDFAMLNRVRAIDFKGTKGQRTFKAKFSDRAGNVAVASLGLELTCRDELIGLVGACAGACADVDRNGANCGVCGQKCGAGKICRAGKCRPSAIAGNVSECIARSAAGPGTTCSAICSEASTGGCDQDGLYGFRKDDPQCMQTPVEIGPCTQVIDDPFFACLCRPRP